MSEEDEELVVASLDTSVVTGLTWFVDDVLLAPLEFPIIFLQSNKACVCMLELHCGVLPSKVKQGKRFITFTTTKKK